MKIYLNLVIILSILSECEPRKKKKKPNPTNIAKAARGFKYQGKFFKVLGPKGKGRTAFLKLEETRKETEEQNGHQSDKELKLQTNEEVYYHYLEQRTLAVKHGLDPDLVPVPKEVVSFLSENHVGKTEAGHRKRRSTINENGFGNGGPYGRVRQKRFAVSDDDQSWTNAILPYRFTKEVNTDEMKYGIIRAQNRYEYWTCARFVPWASNTSKIYNLDHDNYLKYVNDDGCWAVLGNTKGDGQQISCCADEICIHELGHALGLQHEQKNYLHNDWVRVNYDNIDETKTAEFVEIEPVNSKTFGYYDLSSRMHYSLFSFNKNAKPVMTINDPELEYMVLAPDPYHFYQFSEASKVTRCKELKCKNFKGKCENGGYVAYIRGKCTCRCPDGLDPTTGCTTKYYGDPTLNFQWPAEGFSLLTSSSRCPPGFVTLSLASYMFGGDYVSLTDPQSSQLKRTSICSKMPKVDDGYSLKWPAGKYCILRFNGNCPKGFSQEDKFATELKEMVVLKQRLNERFKSPEDLVDLLSDNSKPKSLSSFLCCRSDGEETTPIKLPTYHPFILMKHSTQCQQVEGMSVGPTDLESNAGFTDGVVPCLYTSDNSGNGFSSSSWPNEHFSILQPTEGCPVGLLEDSFSQVADRSIFSDTYHLDSNLLVNKFITKICKSNKVNGQKSISRWEPGQYCILQNEDECPEDFEKGLISNRDADISLKFCCRQDGSTLDPIVLPSSKPFVLFQKDSESCQTVKDMESQTEWYMTRPPDSSSSAFTISGNTPRSRLESIGQLYLDFCYYWPINYDCGKVIQLDADNPTAEIKSPNFPADYNNQQQCAWTITSPPDTQMILNFDYFQVEAGLDDSCVDYLEVRFTLPGQPGINYCGENFNSTTVTEMNYLGLILSSGLTGQRPGFSATVKLLQKSDLCYTKKGEDYRGKVNVTRKFETCLPWSHVEHCPHHLFHQKDLDDGLSHNYCRNPGDGTRPWCYTHADECLRNYCDVCNIERCYDIFDDCAQLVKEDKQYCVNDVEATRGCRKYCGLCNTDTPSPVSSIKCGPPDEISDSNIESDLKQEYHVGEEIVYKCTAGPEKETRRCLPDGTWSTIGFVCGRCPSGWLPFNEKCYKWFDVMEDRLGAKEYCEKLGATVTTARDADENNFLMSARSESRNVWLGLIYVRKLNSHIWEEDDSLVTWTNWQKGKKKKCGFLHASGKWFGVGCDKVEFMSVICQFKPSERQICTDARTDCDEIISSEPGACVDFPNFSEQICPESCGFCSNGEEMKCQKVPTPPQHARELHGLEEVAVGEMFEYKCDKGFVLTDGNLRQACLKTGHLTGSPPKCKEKLADRNNDVVIRERRLDVKGDIAVTALNDEMRIHKTGLLVAWEFYSLYNGDVTFQIWRKTGKKFSLKLVGQNTVHGSKEDRKSKRMVEPSQQISVHKGDLIGIYVSTPTMSGMTYDKCIIDYADDDSGNQLQAKEATATAEDWVIGHRYTFIPTKEDCKIFSVTAYVL